MGRPKAPRGSGEADVLDDDAVAGLRGEAQLAPGDLVALGITNQRETTVVWDRATGAPVQNAINWGDIRTDHLIRELASGGGQDRFRDRCGLPLATYFSGPKIRWLLDHVPGLGERARRCSGRWTPG